MKMFLKELCSLLRRHTAPLTLHTAGLALAFAVVIALVTEFSFSWNYNRCLKHRDEIFVLVNEHNGTLHYEFARPLLEELGDSILRDELMDWGLKEFSWLLQACTEDSTVFFEATTRGIAGGYFEVMGFDWVEADTAAVRSRGVSGRQYLFLPESLALKVFGTTRIVGRRIVARNNRLYQMWTIGGVYRDFPENCSVANSIYNDLNDWEQRNYENSDYIGVFRLKHPERKDSIAQWLSENMGNGCETRIRLMPFSELFYNSDIHYEKRQSNSSREREAAYLLLTLSVLVLAAVNFTSFYMALVPFRMRGINTRRVLGAGRFRLVAGMTGETVAFAFIAWVAACIGTSAAAPYVNGMLGLHVGLSAHPWIVAATGLAAILTGVLTGLYPACYAVSVRPSMALKGNFGLTRRGRRIRRSMTALQFVLTFVMLVMAVGMLMQNRFMRHSDLGYDQKRLVYLNTAECRMASGSCPPDFVERVVRAVPGVVGTSRSVYPLSSRYTHDVTRWGRGTGDRNISFIPIYVTEDFLRVAGIEILEGRDFCASDTVPAFIFNECARRKFPHVVQVGDSMKEYYGRSYPIVGICRDFHFTTLRDSIRPLAFICSPRRQEPGYLNIRIEEGENADSVCRRIETVCRYAFYASNLRVRTQSELMDNIYPDEMREQRSVVWLCLIFLFITLCGLFAITQLEGSSRVKEIGVRKVLGATSQQIMALFLREYGVLTGWCFLVAVPLGGGGLYLWLRTFAYHIPLSVWIFLSALAFFTPVVLGVVWLQHRRPVRAMPADCIRTE